MRKKSRNNHLYSREQRLLLRALLRPGDEGVAAWHQWCRSMDIRDAGYACQRLFPLVYRFLQRRAIPYPEMDRLKGVYRKSLIQHRLLVQRGMEVIDRFLYAGLEVMLLEGAAMTWGGYYADAALRPMESLDLLVPHERRREAERLAGAAGWSAPEPMARNRRRWGHSLKMQNGPVGLHLHWHLHFSGMDPSSDRPLWERATRRTINNRPLWRLCPAHQLLHTCLYGLSWNPGPAILWIVDACRILEQNGETLDWDVLTAEATKRKVGATVAAALDLLGSEYGAPVPSRVTADLTAGAGAVEKAWSGMNAPSPGSVRRLLRNFLKFRIYYRERFSCREVLKYLRVHY